MRRSGSGRVARKVGAYDDSGDSAQSSQGESTSSSTANSVVKRPTFSKFKKRSSLRISFGPGESDANDANDSSDAPAATPKKTNLSRLAVEKSAQLRSKSPLVTEMAQADGQDERPSYSKDYIAELRNSTPSKPIASSDMDVVLKDEEELSALEIVSKFGSIAKLSEPVSAIPTAAQIKEKKARRRRLAKQQNAQDDEEDRPWASDHDDEDEFRAGRNEITIRPKDKYGETRFDHDDEDIMEGFDDFVEDGKISLGRKSERQAASQRRAEMAELIQDAERGSEDDGSDESEEERNAAFAAAQARAGTYSTREKGIDEGARTPPRLPPLPDLDDVLSSLKTEIGSMEQRREAMLQKLEELKEDKERVEQRKQFIQEQLKKTGDEFEKLRLEAGTPAGGVSPARLGAARGLDSLGGTPLRAGLGADSMDEESEDDEAKDDEW